VRVVLDTNILAPESWRAEFGQNNFLQALQGKFDLVVSPPILDELEEVLRRPRLQLRHRWSDVRIAIFLERLRNDSILVMPEVTLDVVRNADDNRIIEAAIAGEAEYIVTKDRDLLDMSEYAGIRIVSPAAFLAILRETPSA
jgi:uncharacterized protein